MYQVHVHELPDWTVFLMGGTYAYVGHSCVPAVRRLTYLGGAMETIWQVTSILQD